MQNLKYVADLHGKFFTKTVVVLHCYSVSAFNWIRHALCERCFYKAKAIRDAQIRVVHPVEFPFHCEAIFKTTVLTL